MQAPATRTLPRPLPWRTALLALIAFAAAVGLAACGGGSPAPESTGDAGGNAAVQPSGPAVDPDTSVRSDGALSADADTASTEPAAHPGAADGGMSLEDVGPDVIFPSNPACMGLPAPDTFMTFEGRRYRLVEVTCGQGIDFDTLTVVGTATQIDLDHEGPVTVYAHAGGVLYTQQPGSGESPTTWNRWEPAG